jgi:hypothetical protein
MGNFASLLLYRRRLHPMKGVVVVVEGSGPELTKMGAVFDPAEKLL